MILMILLAQLNAKHERQGGRRWKNKFTWFSTFRLRVGFEPACFLCGLCASSERSERVWGEVFIKS
jgi:hypothetical protein